MTPREQIEKLIFIDIEPTQKQEELLDVIVTITEMKMKAYVDPIPEELQYIVTEVAIKRYNRIGSEGMTSESVEGHSISFSNSDFDEYLDAIESYLNKNSEVTRKKVYFL